MRGVCTPVPRFAYIPRKLGVVAISALHPTGVVRCDRGHPQVQANLYWQTDKRDGVTRPGCRLCRNERAQKARQQARRERSEAKVGLSGHLIFGDNAARLTTSTRKVYVACRTCRTAAVVRSRAKRGGESVAATTMHVPGRSSPIRSSGRSRSGRPCRRSCANVLQASDGRPAHRPAGCGRDPTGRSCARVWNRFGVDAAAIAFIEALVEQSRHSTSPRLRIDRVLGALLGLQRRSPPRSHHRAGFYLSDRANRLHG